MDEVIFSVGDTVILSSGSVPGVITEVVDEDTVTVAIGTYDDIEYHELPVDCLELVEIVYEDSEYEDEE